MWKASGDHNAVSSILVDSRVGSKELVPHLTKMNIPCVVTELEFGDFAFEGNGRKGTVMIGIERKTVGDMLDSMHSGRFSGHQLNGLLTMYDAQYLFVEGRYRPNSTTGQLEEWSWKLMRWVSAGPMSRRIQYRELDNFLNSIEMQRDVRIRRSESLWETGVMVANLYRLWQKQWDNHVSHLGYHVVESQRAYLNPPSLCERWAKELSGIGVRIAPKVAKALGTGWDLARATEEDLVNAGLGKALAKKVWTEIRGKR